MYLGSWKIGDTVMLMVSTQHPTSGMVVAADASPTFQVYQNSTSTPLATGSLTAINATHALGLYGRQLSLTSASGFVKGASYWIRVAALVGGVAGAVLRTFQIEAEVDANIVSDKTDYGLTSAERVAITETATGAWTALGYTPERAALLDAPVSSRLAASGYTAPGSLASSGQVALLQADVDDIQSRLPAVLIDGRMSSHVGSIAAGAVTSGTLHTLTYERIADGVWDENVAADHQTVGTAGHIIGQRLDVPVGTRLASGSYTAPDNTTLSRIETHVLAVSGLVDDLESRVTVARASLIDNLGLLDTPVSSRLAASGYTAPDYAIVTRIESHVLAVSGLVDSLETRLTPIRAALLDNLTHLDVPISSRLAASGYTAPDAAMLGRVETHVLAISGLVDDLESRFTAARAALVDNLSRLDVPVSSRLAATGTVSTYLSSGEIALAVDNRLIQTHGAGTWVTTALGSGSYQVRVHLSDGSEDIPGLLVMIRNAGGTLLARSTTDSSGSIYFQLDPGSYQVYIRTTVDFESLGAQALTVSGNMSVTYTLTRHAGTVISPTGQRILKPPDPRPWS